MIEQDSHFSQKRVYEHSGTLQFSDEEEEDWSDYEDEYGIQDDWDDRVRDDDRENPYVVNAARATTMAHFKPWDHWADFGEVNHQPHCNHVELPERARQFFATVERCQAGNDRIRYARLGLSSESREVPPTNFQSD